MKHMLLSQSQSDSSSQASVVLEPSETSLLQELVHVALKIRSDLFVTDGHESLWKWIDIDHVVKIIPESLFLLLRIIFDGMNVLDGEESDLDKAVCRKVCSIAQDIIFGVSNGTKLTTKHVGLGIALHQATRFEMLVNLFHSAYHTVGITTIRRIDNSITNNILERYLENGCVYIPDNIDRGIFAHFSCDNKDVLESTLDIRNTFHSTQMEPNNQSVPAWRAYNESSSPVNPPMTNIGILPILQAPADEYDTITTVMNKFSPFQII